MSGRFGEIRRRIFFFVSREIEVKDRFDISLIGIEGKFERLFEKDVSIVQIELAFNSKD